MIRVIVKFAGMTLVAGGLLTWRSAVLDRHTHPVLTRPAACIQTVDAFNERQISKLTSEDPTATDEASVALTKATTPTEAIAMASEFNLDITAFVAQFPFGVDSKGKPVVATSQASMKEAGLTSTLAQWATDMEHNMDAIARMGNGPDAEVLDNVREKARRKDFTIGGLRVAGTNEALLRLANSPVVKAMSLDEKLPALVAQEVCK